MKNNLLTRENGLSPWLLAPFAVCAASGILIVVMATGALQQAVGLMHFGMGLLLIIPLLVYVFVHFLRVMGARRPSLLFTGIAAVLATLLLIGTGLYTGIVGQQESRRWVVDLHWYLGFITVGAVLGHLLLHVITFPARRRAVTPQVFLTLGRLPLVLLATAVPAAALVTAVFLLDQSARAEYFTPPDVTDYGYTYGSHPFRPSQTETSSGGFIASHHVLGSEECAGCHTDIAAQWASSAHRKSASDIAYRTNIGILVERSGMIATRYCEGCHTPAALLSGQLKPGGQHGAIPGAVGHEEGISCLACHRMSNVEHTKGVASYEFDPATRYLFADAKGGFLQRVNRFAISTMPEQHRQEMSTPTLSDPKMCATCHTQFMDEDINGWGFVQMQDEYSAWLASPYAGQHEQRFSTAETQRCQDCHMPLVEAEDPSANADGRVRSHRFLGANTMLALMSGDQEQLALTKQFLQTNKMRISIEEPHRADAAQTLQPVEQRLRTTPNKPYYYYKGEEAVLNVIVSNIGVGHDFPGGTIDINQAWIHFRVTDAEGSLIYESGFVDDEHYVDPDAYFYRSLPVDRKGDLVWTHNLFEQIGEVARNVVKAGESDSTRYSFRVPSWAKSPLYVSSSLMYRKLNNRYAKLSMGEHYQPLPIVEMARDFLTIPIRDQVEAAQTEQVVAR